MYSGSEHRAIVHLDLDTFFVSCERLLDSRLMNQPVLIGGTSDRGVVASCSYEAREFGIHSAMPMKLARQLIGEVLEEKIAAGYFLHEDARRLAARILRENAICFFKLK